MTVRGHNVILFEVNRGNRVPPRFPLYFGFNASAYCDTEEEFMNGKE
jgi:hypothetical protein